MSYSELIKNFEKIRDYMKEFYIYGFKSREEYNKKSARSYDNEKRRIESYLGSYMYFRQKEHEKNVFLSIDSRSSSRNPLYNALKAKSFTDGDITLHFIIFDILHSPEIRLSLSEITEKIDKDYLSHFEIPMMFDESTVRKKLQEYAKIGIIETEKQGKKMLYSRTPENDLSSLTDAVSFFSETGLCGVVGSFILDKTDYDEEFFSFKHHYITHALESEILCTLFDAMRQKASVTVNNKSRRSGSEKPEKIVPLKIFVSVQNGRRYLAAYSPQHRNFKLQRLDYLSDVKIEAPYSAFDEKRTEFAEVQKHMWGVVTDKKEELEHVEFCVHVDEGEEYIVSRLEREKRTGTVEKIDENTWRFSADVYDASELNPWIRTFVGRIKSINYSNVLYENRFRMDLCDMYRLYNIGGEE